MRKLISVTLLLVIVMIAVFSVSHAMFGAEGARRTGGLREDGVNFGRRYNNRALDETGAANVVAAVVVSYRGFDTLGEVTVLFVAALGLGALLYGARREKNAKEREPASLIVFTGCRFLFPLVLLFGAYVLAHGHVTPGGGFQGGAIVASGFVLVYLGCRGTLPAGRLAAAESLSGLAFVVIGFIGLAVGGSFLLNFLPRGTPLALFSAGVIPVIYVAIGLKVGSELGGIIGNLAGEVSE